ncbi:hypothetical protein FGO68_gene13507 [Halteria grandinella]|uniref:Uncharacterized protein n=1 Tax=Halteria grandinella TaxID=5974 RepID=A0A8J8P305_HALGN|nr:hypothetical protein FGO68_gene13507 [Halteria grandinella]
MKCIMQIDLMRRGEELSPEQFYKGYVDVDADLVRDFEERFLQTEHQLLIDDDGNNNDTHQLMGEIKPNKQMASMNNKKGGKFKGKKKQSKISKGDSSMTVGMKKKTKSILQEEEEDPDFNRDEDSYFLLNKVGGESSLLLEQSSSLDAHGTSILQRPYLTKVAPGNDLDVNNISPWNLEGSFINKKRRGSDSRDSTRKANALLQPVKRSNVDAKE